MIDVAPNAPPALRFSVESVEPWRRAAVPTLRIAVRVSAPSAAIRGLGLNVEARIAAERRRYDDAETGRLREIFGAPEDWARSLGPIHWARTAINVPPFEGETLVDVLLPCGYDFEIVAVKYATALSGGDIPVELLFGGNVFYSTPEGRLQTAKIGWDSEIAVRVPLAMWRDAVDAAFPDAAWLRLDRALLVRLQTYRAARALTTWDETLGVLLEDRGV